MAPAKTLLEAYQATDPRPLPSGDPYFVDLTRARASQATVRLCQMIENCGPTQFAAIAFSGHRGSGKSTELSQLRQALSARCFTLNVDVQEFLDPADVDYTDLFLLISRAVLDELEKNDVHLSGDLLKAVEDWFRTVTKETEQTVNLSAGISAQATAGASLPFIARLLAKLTADVKVGSSNKVTTRSELDRYFTGLSTNTNLLLTAASEALHKAGKPSRILVVVDNLDRMPPKKSEELFFSHGSQLQALNCHAVYTLSIETYYSTRVIANVFPRHLVLPNVKLRKGKSNADQNEQGFAALREVIARRIDIESLVRPASIAEGFIARSGGSVRQLIRLLSEAILSAQARGLAAIDAEGLEDASISLQQDFERSLEPDDYAILARVAKSKTIEKSAAFMRLLSTMAVLEYNGTDIWHDVNPLIETIDAFSSAQKKRKRPASVTRKRPSPL